MNEQITVRVSKPGEVVEFDLTEHDLNVEVIDKKQTVLSDTFVSFFPKDTVASLNLTGHVTVVRACLPMNRWPRIKIALQQLKEALFNA